jgi:serine/threonine protein kinase
MDYIKKYIKYKNKMCVALKRCQYGGSLFCDMKIIKKIGKGNFGQVYLVKINEKNFILKRQKITTEDYLSNPNDITIFINVELDFYKWIKTIDEQDKFFFMEMYEFRRYECDFEFIPIMGPINTELSNSKYCQDTIVSLKDGTVINIINDLLKEEIISIFIQIVHAIYLMHKNGYYHCDTKIDNIGYTITHEKYITIGTNKIKSYRKIACLMDYGSVISDKNKKKINSKYDEQLEMQELYNIDLWNIIDSLLLNNTNIYIQMGNLGFSAENILRIIILLENEIIDEILSLMTDYLMLPNMNLFSIFIYEHKASKIKYENKIQKTLLYEFLQILSIVRYDIFIKCLNDIFGIEIKPAKRLFVREEIMTIKKSHNDMKKIIEIFKHEIVNDSENSSLSSS